MNVTEQEFKYMVEGITSDLIQFLMERKQYTLPRAVDVVYGSNAYRAPTASNIAAVYPKFRVCLFNVGK